MSLKFKPRLTHFISLPIGHHAPLRESISAFTESLLDNNPPIPGLHNSIIIHPRRLHLTLGVMALSSQPDDRATLSAAQDLLSSLAPRLKTITAEQKLRVPLEVMHIMSPERGNPTRAQVLWLGPSPDSEDSLRLKSVCDLIHTEFMRAGLLVDERRPLKLHCTVINTTHRKPRPQNSNRRIPFSYSAILASPALQPYSRTDPRLFGTKTIEEEHAPESLARAKDSSHKQPMHVDFGTWDIDEVQICAMGSRAPDGAYVRCDGISL